MDAKRSRFATIGRMSRRSCGDGKIGIAEMAWQQAFAAAQQDPQAYHPQFNGTWGCIMMP
jgi:hypothetical protein